MKCAHCGNINNQTLWKSSTKKEFEEIDNELKKLGWYPPVLLGLSLRNNLHTGNGFIVFIIYILSHYLLNLNSFLQ